MPLQYKQAVTISTSEDEAEFQEQQAIIDEIDSRYNWNGTANTVQHSEVQLMQLEIFLESFYLFEIKANCLCHSIHIFLDSIAHHTTGRKNYQRL